MDVSMKIHASQVVTTADVFGIYQEGVQQHLDDAFANKAHPGDSPQFPVASGPFTNTKQPPSTAAPAVAALAAAATPTIPPAPPAEQQHAAQSGSTDQHAAAEPQPADATAESAMQEAAAPSADHTAAELPAGVAHDAAALTAVNGIPTAIVPSDGDAVVEGASTASTGKADQDAAPAGVMSVDVCALRIVKCNGDLMSRSHQHRQFGEEWVRPTTDELFTSRQIQK